MQNQITKLQQNFDQELSSCQDEPSLEKLELTYLGRKGHINTLFQTLPIKQDKSLALAINSLKTHITERIATHKSSLHTQETQIDFSIPGLATPVFRPHAISRTISEITDIFHRLGFVRRRYPEIDSDWYYATGLNIPADHPARDDQETFYLAPDTVLTAHTSNGQLHEMEATKPPIKMINIGKTYRRQADASHNSMFHQFEGLVIDTGINLSHLIGVTDYFAKSFFGPDRRTRLRPHHFQFTEPSFEIDISCGNCQGTGVIDDHKCKLCKSGWLELGGAGMVHPNVLKNGKIDPTKYSGFAFGWGVERVYMMKSDLKLPDLRLLLSDDIQILKQL
jgi:phenylalanyl-tRNA synthetase alpha chain